ncbi:glycosyltransferase family 4 protein [Kineococcus radiotolerans]|uniref:Glycosyl transferase group 1 n=1 Tax=Kineococcus radiotolerans (strain ATCC BAA-149 / DSM 14245 / SRS30216) TaxID=266940 RepID=A6WBS8_KINRD|nr:glycosyltransferase family 4 protein [Kineococcus radiotolerans]ABS04267.1 glycosyl transferase group 1 [Kineococcus radiotolerans SRS30216 = ATCC BAA-149]
MRVVHVSLDPGVPVFGGKGCSVHVQEVLRVLVAAGHDVHLVTTRLGGPAPAGLEAVTVHPLDLPGGRSRAERETDLRAADARAGRVVAALVASAPGEVLVYERYALFACTAQETARALGVASVLEVNAPLPLEQARHRALADAAGAEETTRRAVAAAARVVAVSSAVGRWVSSVHGGTEVVVVPNGVDTARFAPSPPGPDRVRPEVVRIAFVGAFRPWHGVDLLVEAAGRLAARPGPEVELLLVGDGPGRPAALARAGELGLRVDAPGALDPADVPARLAAADVAVAPYPVGGGYFSPLKVAEYLACGVATVAGAVGDLASTYRDGEELLLVEPGDVDALTAALQRLRRDPARRAGLAAAGRLAVVRRGTWQRVVDRSLAGLAPGRGRGRDSEVAA